MKLFPILYSRPLFLLTVICLLTLSSCKKFVQIEPAPNLINSPEVFTNDKTALSAASGVYAQLRGSTLIMTNGGLSLFTALSSDELNLTSTNATYDPFWKDSIPSNNSSIQSNFWSSAYLNIYKTNSVIEGLSSPTCTVSQALKEQLIGEMKVIRSLYYFYLVNLFGDVPLVMTTDYERNAVLPRTAVAQIYTQLISDLLDAESLLKSDYPSAGKVRCNKWAATALLARVYLYTNNWVKAEEKSSAVINSSLYNLAVITDVFLKNSSETILEIASNNEISNTPEGASFIPSSTTVKPTFILNPYLVSDFEPGDLRRKKWVDSNTVSNVRYLYPKKYKQRSVTTPVAEYEIIFRLAELYLIRAEARAQLMSNSGAQADLNIIRSRAGLGNTAANSLASLLTAIEHERRTELFCEWGQRWFDLKRTGRIDALLGFEKGNWKAYSALYPIPNAQLLLNVYLVQNPGY